MQEGKEGIANFTTWYRDFYKIRVKTQSWSMISWELNPLDDAGLVAKRIGLLT